MVDRFWSTGRARSIVSGQLLDVRPKRQEPSLEIMLRRMWMELVVVFHSRPRLLFGIIGDHKIVDSSVDVD